MKRLGALVVVLGAVAALGGCGTDAAAPPQHPPWTPPPGPAYDGTLIPFQAVLALVPERARVLTVTDLHRTRKDGARPLFLDRLPKGVDARGADWVAVWTGGDSGGWAVERDGRLRTRGRAVPGRPSWASHSALKALLPQETDAAYVERGCVNRDTDSVLLDPLDAYSVSYGDLLATVRLGPGRTDVFTRMRLGRQELASAYARGSADPATGRIGYELTDPARAARLAERHELPFAACGTE